MNYLSKFLIAATAVFVMMALLSPIATFADHDADTPTFLVIVDWDANGQPYIDDEWQPQPLDTLEECMVVGNFAEMIIQGSMPDRRYVSACVHPSDGMSLDDIIDQIIDDFTPYFTPVGEAV